MEGGIKNQLTNKGIKLKLTNLDKSYNYIKVYYVRYFADYQQNRVTECKKIYKNYPVNSNVLYIQITGYEETQDIDANILNISRFNPKNVLTSAQCKNMLFFGNIVKNTDNYKELSDCALRIIPKLVTDTLHTVDQNYNATNDVGYYNSLNIYNKVGYFNNEYYRFGVVFIYQNGTISNVYNTLGGELTSLNGDLSIKDVDVLFTNDEIYSYRQYIKLDEDGWVDSAVVTGGNYVNGRGVCKLNYSNSSSDTIFGISFSIPDEVIKHLKDELGIRGLFFVRQKCIPNILAQCYILPMDEQLEAPVIKYGNNYITECFVQKDDRLVTNDYNKRLYTYKDPTGAESGISTNAYAAICPDFLLNQPYYNQIFNGAKFLLQKVNKQELTKDERFYRYGTITNEQDNKSIKVTINTVTDDVPTVAIQDKIFRLEIGETEEAYKFQYAQFDNGTYNAGDDDSQTKINEATNIVRGKYSPYLAIYSDTELDFNYVYNILQEGNISPNQEYQNRMDSSEAFYAISDRYNFSNLISEFDFKKTTCWRGDCYVNNFTFRLNRNFNDPSLPNNDKIIDKKTWKDNYDVTNSSKWEDISRSDLNAVQMGSWITIKVRSAMNYALRSQDHSYVSEEALMGSPRSYYPRNKLMWRGENKMPDSYLFNDAYRASLGFKCYFTLNNINYIKDSFSNRIQYSSISIQDSFKNNYRESLSTYYRDYSQEYGGIMKLVGFEGYLLVVFEHAIGIAVVNERVLAGNGDGEPVFINTSNVLPEELTIITDTYGTQWTESVVKSEAGYVYGVDTIAKKIWRVKGQEIEIISDFKVNKFLIDNISLGERELYPTVGLRNVKTHYNNNKKDIMFTFYDDVYKDEEKVWNLCYNELLGEFVTFYSWVPSYSENIDTQFFTFNRDTSKYLALLSKCNYSIPENSGVLVDSPILSDFVTDLYYSCDDNFSVTILNEDGTTTLKQGTKQENGQCILKDISFKVEKDHWQNWKLVDNIDESGNVEEVKINVEITAEDGTTENIIKTVNNRLIFKNNATFQKALKEQKVLLLYITPYIATKAEGEISALKEETTFKTEVIAVTTQEIIDNPLLTKKQKEQSGLTTDFYLHGQAGIFNVAENLYPTYWYGEYHPFEFEFVVNDKVSQQKIFDNLVIISNKAEPESFHFEIEGDNYEFSQDKRTMYFRQEATKELYQNLGSDMLFDRYYTDVVSDNYTQEQYYRGNRNYDLSHIALNNKYSHEYPKSINGLVQQYKSTIFPLYYERIDKYNEIYHTYRDMLDGISNSNYDFKNLSGSEIKWNRDLNQFNIVTHIKNSPIDYVGRLRGNSRYKEGKWNVQIPSIIFNQKNEYDDNDATTWLNTYQLDANGNIVKDEDNDNNPIVLFSQPRIVVNSSNIPADLKYDSEKETVISADKIPNIYTRDITKTRPVRAYVDTEDWSSRKEARIRDKWMKVRIRYSGKNLAIIHSLITLYNVSYS